MSVTKWNKQKTNKWANAIWYILVDETENEKERERVKARKRFWRRHYVCDCEWKNNKEEKFVSPNRRPPSNYLN